MKIKNLINLFIVVFIIVLGIGIYDSIKTLNQLEKSKLKIAELEKKKKGIENQLEIKQTKINEIFLEKDKLNKEVLELIVKLKKKPKTIIKKITEVKTIEIDKKKYVLAEVYSDCQKAWAECYEEREILIKAFGKNYKWDLSLKENINKVFKLNLELKQVNEKQKKELIKVRNRLARKIKFYKYSGVIVTILGLIVLIAK